MAKMRELQLGLTISCLYFPVPHADMTGLQIAIRFRIETEDAAIPVDQHDSLPKCVKRDQQRAIPGILEHLAEASGRRQFQGETGICPLKMSLVDFPVVA